MSLSGFEGHFRTERLMDDFRGRSVRAGAATIAAQAARLLLTIGSTMVLARLLAPEEFGRIAMVVAVIGLLIVFRDLGLPTATVRQPEISHEQVSSLFWVNLLLSIGIALVATALAPLLAWFYREPALLRITPVFGIISLADGLSLQHRALLGRQMRFGALALIEVFSLAAGVAIAIVSALLGARYWALVLYRLVTAITQTIACWAVCDWRPGGRIRLGEIRSMLEFGGFLSGSRMVRYLGRNLDRVVIGRSWSADSLGLYSKANGWMLGPFQQASWTVAKVAVPVLSRLQSEPDRYRRYFRQGMLLLIAPGMPFIAFFFLDAEKVIRILLGNQWDAAIPILRILAPAAVAALLNMGSYWVYASLGRAGRMLGWDAGATLATAVGILVGVRWGPKGVAAAYSLVTTLLFFPGIAYCFRGTSLRACDLLGAAWRPILASIPAGAFLFATRSAELSPGGRLLSLGLDLTLFGAIYLLAWIAVPGGIPVLRSLARLAMEIRGAPGRGERAQGPAR
jgi:O-antigen/teichoic acid export membrane protein